MQTFLISSDPSFVETMQALDSKRLGKQRVEALQICKALLDSSYGWQNHPAVKMWRGHLDLLQCYHDACIHEWKMRGFKNTMPYLTTGTIESYVRYPAWWTDMSVFASHRSNLLRKMPEHYSKFGWSESNDMPYVWPVRS